MPTKMDEKQAKLKESKAKNSPALGALKQMTGFAGVLIAYYQSINGLAGWLSVGRPAKGITEQYHC